MKALLTFLLIGVMAIQVFAQTIPQNPNTTDANGLRQGKWTILYDEHWHVISSYAEAKFYRLITYTDDKPTGKVTDHFLNGTIQWEGELLADRPEDVMNGTAKWYRENGTIEVERVFEAGKIVSENFYDIDGNMANDSWSVLQQQGEQVFQQGHYSRAVSIFEKAREKALLEFGEGHENYNISGRWLGFLFHYQGRHSEAEPLYLEAKAIWEKTVGKEHPDYAISCNNLAALYEDQGRYSEAEILHLEARGIWEKTIGKSHPDYAVSCINLANLYEAQSRYEEAELLCIEAKKIVGKEHSAYATSCIILANMYRLQGRFTEAEPLFLEAKELREKAQGKAHPLFASSCNDLANLYLKQGRYTEAESLYLESKNIWENTVGKAGSNYALTCNNLANLYTEQGRYSEAEPLYFEAKEIREKTFGKTHLDYATSCNSLAWFYQRQGRHAESEVFWVEGNQSHFYQLGRNFATLSEKEKEQFLRTFNDSFEAFYSFVLHRQAENPGITAEAYRVALATKGLLFDSSNKIRERILNSRDKELIALYRRWKGQREYLAQLYNQPIAELDRKGVSIKAEEEKANDLEKQLASRSYLFSQANDNTFYNWQDVQKALKPGEAAVELVQFNYFDFQTSWSDSVLYMALIITPETRTAPEMVVLANGNDLEGKYLRAYKNFVRYKLEDEYSYQQFWEPLKKRLKDAKKVYLSPDGVYHSVSLMALQNPETGRYVADEIDIQLVTNTKDLLRTKSKKQARREAKILGFPAYYPGETGKADGTGGNRGGVSPSFLALQDTSNTRFFDGETIRPLPATRVEVSKVAELLKKKGLNISVLTESEATETVVKSVENPAILHIATHGYFLADAEKQKESSRLMGISRQQIIENPLLRSGLMLANAGVAISDGGDGILTAYEAMSLNLDNTELVVLSACETGLGEIRNGEGVFGMQRAFQTAGAEAVLMSLWQVSDEATQELMVLFYQSWVQKGMSKREAFKQAQSALRQKYPEPYYWGAFVLVGE